MKKISKNDVQKRTLKLGEEYQSFLTNCMEEDANSDLEQLTSAWLIVKIAEIQLVLNINPHDT